VPTSALTGRRVLKEDMRSDLKGNKIHVAVVQKKDNAGNLYVEKSFDVIKHVGGDPVRYMKRALVKDYLALNWLRQLGLKVPNAELIRDQESNLILRTTFVPYNVTMTDFFQRNIQLAEKGLNEIPLSTEAENDLALFGLAAISVLSDDMHYGNLLLCFSGERSGVWGIDFESSFLFPDSFDKLKQLVYDLIMKHHTNQTTVFEQRIPSQFEFDDGFSMATVIEESRFRQLRSLAHRIRTFPDAEIEKIAHKAFSYLSIPENVDDFIKQWSQVRKVIGYVYMVHPVMPLVGESLRERLLGAEDQIEQSI